MLNGSGRLCLRPFRGTVLHPRMLWARAAHSGPEDALLSSPRLNKTRLMQEKVANLRQTCLRVGLPASGTKPQIVERLLDLHRAAKQSEGGAGEAGDLSSSPGDPTRTPISAAARAPGGAGTPALPWQPGPATAPPPPSSAPPSPAPGAPFPSHLPPADPFSVTWLGTSSGSPSVRRNVSCLGVRWGPDASYLVDCGEGSAAQLHAARWDLASVRAIMITHAHGDHCFGLPGVLQAVDEARRRSGRNVGAPLVVVGPLELHRMLDCAARRGTLHAPATALSFVALTLGPTAAAARRAGRGGAGAGRGGAAVVPLRLQPPDQAPALAPQRLADWQAAYEAGDERVVQVGLTWTLELPGGASAAAAQLLHRVPCWGYVLRERSALAAREGPGEGAAAGLAPAEGSGPGPTPLNTPGVVRPGRKLVLLGDTAESTAIATLARGADLVSHEATFCARMQSKARIATHSTALEAGRFAAQVGARLLVLTHFSARYDTPSRRDGGPEEGRGRGRRGGGPPPREPEAPPDVPEEQLQVLLREAAQGLGPGGKLRLARDLLTWRLPPHAARAVPSLPAAAAAASAELRPPTWDEEGWARGRAVQAPRWPPSYAAPEAAPARERGRGRQHGTPRQHGGPRSPARRPGGALQGRATG
uniref:SAP domain-containing protein n=1 Tax=Auxenochlorella protothecoides TaxID=3075 RepID=A0A1D2A4U1_AUXPR